MVRPILISNSNSPLRPRIQFRIRGLSAPAVRAPAGKPEFESEAELQAPPDCQVVVRSGEFSPPSPRFRAAQTFWDEPSAPLRLLATRITRCWVDYGKITVPRLNCNLHPSALRAGPHLNARFPSLLMKKIFTTRSLLLLFVAQLALSQTPQLKASQMIKGPPNPPSFSLIQLIYLIGL
jgi:hypothetical protein